MYKFYIKLNGQKVQLDTEFVYGMFHEKFFEKHIIDLARDMRERLGVGEIKIEHTESYCVGDW
jgi:hypothetical protein